MLSTFRCFPSTLLNPQRFSSSSLVDVTFLFLWLGGGFECSNSITLLIACSNHSQIPFVAIFWNFTFQFPQKWLPVSSFVGGACLATTVHSYVQGWPVWNYCCLPLWRVTESSFYHLMLISTFLFYLFIFLMAEGWLQYMFFFFLDSICRRYMIVMHDTLSVPALLYCVGIFRLFGIFCMIFICRVCLSMPVLLWGSCNCHFCCNENEFLYYSALSKPGFNLYPYFFPLSLLCW